MAGPITWRNINSNTDTGAVRLLENAQSSFNTGLNGLSKIAEQEQALRAANRGQVRSNNLTDITANLSKFKTVDEFNAADNSGQLDAMLGRYGNNVDRNAVMALRQALPGQLMTRENTQNTFDDNMLQRKVAPILQEYGAANISGDDVTRDDIAARNKDILIRAGKYNEAISQATNQDRSELERGWGDTDHDRNEELYTDQQARNAAINASAANFNNTLTQQASAISALAAEHKLPMLPNNGGVDWEAAETNNPEQLLAFNNAVQQGGLDRVPTATEQSRSLYNALIQQDPNADPAAITAALQTASQMRTVGNTIDPADLADSQERMASLAANMHLDKNSYTIARNSQYDPATVAKDAIKEIDGIKGGALMGILDNEDLSKQVITQIQTALTDGVPVKNADGKEVNIPIVPADVSTALLQFNRSYTEWDEDDLQEIFKRIVQSPGRIKMFEDDTQYQELQNDETTRLEQLTGGSPQSNLEAQVARLRASASRAGAAQQAVAEQAATSQSASNAADTAINTSVTQRYLQPGRSGGSPSIFQQLTAGAPARQKAALDRTTNRTAASPPDQVIKGWLSRGLLPPKDNSAGVELIKRAIRSGNLSTQETKDMKEWLETN